jgi:putative ABC transport system permease protein
VSGSAIELGPVDLALAAALILVNALVSLAFRLGLGRRLVVAAVRATVQLALLGFVLGRVFAAEAPPLVLAVMTAMALLAGIEAVRRGRHRVRGAYPLVMAVMLASSFAITFYGTLAVVGVEPWYAPRYLIPILGMVLGNTLNGISLGLETALAGYRRDRERIEVLLAHGAVPREAAREVVRRAVRTGTTPILNSMVAAGVISIPGMMTGQILAGQPPLSAAAYQVFILFAIAGGTAIGTVGVVLASARLVFDERGRLRTERIEAVAAE